MGQSAHVAASDEVAAIHWLTPEEIRTHENAPDFLLADVERLERHREGTTGQNI